MASDKRMTTIRLGDDDREVLERLVKLTGIDSQAALIRLAIREALASREEAWGKFHAGLAKKGRQGKQ